MLRTKAGMDLGQLACAGTMSLEVSEGHFQLMGNTVLCKLTSSIFGQLAHPSLTDPCQFSLCPLGPFYTVVFTFLDVNFRWHSSQFWSYHP